MFLLLPCDNLKTITADVWKCPQAFKSVILPLLALPAPEEPCTSPASLSSCSDVTGKEKKTWPRRFSQCYD